MANLARFTINYSPSSQRGYDVNPGDYPVLRLEASSSLVNRVTFEVHSSADGAPRSTSNVQILTLNNGAITGQAVDALTPSAAVTVSSGIPAMRAPNTWEIRCTVNGGTNPDGSVNPDYVFSRFIVMRSDAGYRKIVCTERNEYDPVNGWASAQNELIDGLAGAPRWVTLLNIDFASLANLGPIVADGTVSIGGLNWALSNTKTGTYNVGVQIVNGVGLQFLYQATNGNIDGCAGAYSNVNGLMLRASFPQISSLLQVNTPMRVRTRFGDCSTWDMPGNNVTNWGVATAIDQRTTPSSFASYMGTWHMKQRQSVSVGSGVTDNSNFLFNRYYDQNSDGGIAQATINSARTVGFDKPDGILCSRSVKRFGDLFGTSIPYRTGSELWIPEGYVFTSNILGAGDNAIPTANLPACIDVSNWGLALCGCAGASGNTSAATWKMTIRGLRVDAMI